MKIKISRRKFIKLGLTTAVGYTLIGCSPFLEEEDAPLSSEESSPEKTPGEFLDKTEHDEDSSSREPLPEDSIHENEGMESSIPEEVARGGIQKRSLGKTGFNVSIFGLGGAFAIARDRKKSEAILNRALDLGVNFIDTAPTYGSSEAYIGNVMKHRRREVFLASKTLDRSYDGTMRLFQQSLKRLQTDHLDLLQLHGIHTERGLEQSLAPKGALRALEELKKNGNIRFTGITGHRDPQVLLRGIREWDFDCLLMPLNCADIHFRPFQGELLQEACRRDMGVIAMKVASYGRIFNERGITTMKKALGYVLSFPVSAAVLGISTIEELEENVAIASTFTPLSGQKKASLEELVKPYQKEANFFKTQW